MTVVVLCLLLLLLLLLIGVAAVMCLLLLLLLLILIVVLTLNLCQVSLWLQDNVIDNNLLADGIYTEIYMRKRFTADCRLLNSA